MTADRAAMFDGDSVVINFNNRLQDDEGGAYGEGWLISAPQSSTFLQVTTTGKPARTMNVSFF